jgi:hypothetical protein
MENDPKRGNKMVTGRRNIGGIIYKQLIYNQFVAKNKG